MNSSTLQRGKGGEYSTTPLHRISTAQSDWLMWQLSHQTLQSQGLGQLRYHGAICRDDPEKNGGHTKSAQMTRLKCLR